MSGRMRSATCLFVILLLACSATVAQATTITELKTSKNPSTYGQSVTFTALVSGASSGSIAFQDGTTSLGNPSLTPLPATNKLRYSSQYVTGSPPTPLAPWNIWTQDSRSAVAVNSTTASAPDASSTATTFAVTDIGLGGGAGIGMEQYVTYASGVIVGKSFTASVFLRNTPGSPSCHIILGTETSTTWEGDSVPLDTTDTWQRYSVTHTFAQDGLNVSLYLEVPTGCTFDIWGAQLEQDATTAGPYIPTTTAAVSGSGGTASLSTAALEGSPTPHTISATYSGDGSSASVAQQVNNGTVTELRGSPNPATTKQAVTFTALIHTSGGPDCTDCGVPYGSVAFEDTTSGTPVSLGTATVVKATATNELIHSRAFDSAWSIWDGDGSYSLDTTAATAPDDTSTATGFTAGTSDLYIGQSVNTGSSVYNRTFTASVFLRSSSGCSATLGTETPTTWDGNSTAVALSAGGAWQRYTLTYKFANQNDGPNVSLYVNVPAGCSIELWGPQLEEASSAGPYVATGAAATTGSGGLATLSPDVTFSSGGARTIKATYTPDAITSHFQGSGTVPPYASPLTQTVNLPATPTVTLESTANPSVYEQSVNLTATVSGGNGAPTPTGTVSFYDGTTLLGGTAKNLTDGWTSIDCGVGATLTCGAFSVGTHSLKAEYSGDNLYAAGSATLTQTVNKDDTIIQLESDLNPAGYGATVTFTATVGGKVGGGAPTSGTVTIKDGTTTLGSGDLTPTASWISVSTSSLTVGAHSITAVYSGDGANFNGSTSAVLTQNVTGNVSTTTTLQSSKNPSNYGEVVSFTAVVASGSGGTPTGSVTFLDGSTALAPAVNLTGDWATLSCPSAAQNCAALATGSHSITAQYSGDANFHSSTASVTQTVNKTNSTTVLESSANPVGFGGTVTFTATVTMTGGAAASGTVTFSDGSTVLGTETLSSGWTTFTTASLAKGSHTITAVYAGNANANGSQASLTQEVTGNVTTTTTLQTSATSAAPGATITLTATVSTGSGGTPTGTVSFKEGSTVLGSGTLAPAGYATLNISTLTVGSHSITAAYGGDANFGSSTSSAVTIAIVGGSVATSTKLDVSHTSAAPGTTITFTATVTPSSGGPATGTVSFKEGSTVLGTGTLSSGWTTLNLSNLTAGSHSVTAVYGGDTNFAGSTSSAVTVDIQDFALPPASSNPPKTVAAGQPATWTITITPGSGGFTGLVQFTCSWAPSKPTGAECSVSPQSVTPGSSPVTTTLTITTTARTTGMAVPASPWRSLPVYAVFLPLAGAVLMNLRRRNLGGTMLLLVLILLALLAACGDGGSKAPAPAPAPAPNPGTPAGTYTVTVSAQSGSTTHTTSVTLTVQ